MTTYFDCLPAELLRMIFEFMSNCDIIWSFFGVSPYINALVNNYCWHTLNFKSISKTHFDFICDYMNFERVLSLTLSNDSETPGQIQCFFGRFHLQEFINLHTLKLISVNNEDLFPILSNLPKLQYLTTLNIACRCFQLLSVGQILNQLKSLQQLYVSHGDIFDHNVSLPLRNLKVLHAGACNFLELRRLQVIVPSLVTLRIVLQANHQLQLLSTQDRWSSLKQLDLTLSREANTTFHEIQQLISHFQNITHLNLNVQGTIESLAYGYYWETCPTIIRLRKFDFIMQFTESLTDSNPIIERILCSFSTPFWLEVKKWYVVITVHSVHTIPCFDSQSFIVPTSVPMCTCPDYNWFYEQVKRVEIDKSLSAISLNQFYNLEQLDLSEENIPLSILNLHEFTQLRHLILQQNFSNQSLSYLLMHSPQIDHLTLTQYNFDQLSPLETIRCLHLRNLIKITNRSQIKNLSRIFPSVRQLFIHLNSIRLLCYTIDAFHLLENGVFQFYETIKPLSSEWLKTATRLNSDTCSFTCRNELYRILLWINNSAKPLVHLMNNTVQTHTVNNEQKSDKCSVQ